MKIEFKTLKAPPEKSKQAYSIVFIDYEYLYISFTKQYSMPPMLNEICDEIKQNGKVAKMCRAVGFTTIFSSSAY